MKRTVHNPPRFAEWLLARFSTHVEEYSVAGDLHEEYVHIAENRGSVYSFFWYWIQMLRAAGPFLKNSFFWGNVMFSNYIKISFRNLLKHKVYSFINISGLALGIACCVLIVSYVMFELSYDKFHENADRIYRVVSTIDIGDAHFDVAAAPSPMALRLKEEYPEVENFVRFREQGQNTLSYKDIKFNIDHYMYADGSLFEVFSFPLIKGDPNSALKRAFTMVITREIAEKYFGSEDPIGKIMTLGDNDNFTVTGIIEKPPANSHMQFDMLFSFETLYKQNPQMMEVWLGYNYGTYLVLKEESDYREFEKKFVDFNERYVGRLLKNMNGSVVNTLQPLTSIHLHSKTMGEQGGSGDIRYVYAFSAIALFILLLACINFMNLSTARSANRAKEVGMRKALGAFRLQLIRQFLGESVLMTFISFIIALVLVQVFLPYFNNLAATNIRINYFDTPVYLAGLALIFIFTALLAGSYPAFFLAGFIPVKVLKGSVNRGTKSAVFRNSLVVFQFTISIALIIGTGIILNQVKYMKNKNLGFKKEQILVLNIKDEAMMGRIEQVKEELLQVNGVAAVSASSVVPGQGPNTNGYFPEGQAKDQVVLMESFDADADFLKTYNIELAEGRGFSSEFLHSDTAEGALINEMAAKELGWKNPIGKYIGVVDGGNTDDYTQRKKYYVIGVVKNFHMRSLYYPVRAAFIQFRYENLDQLSLRLNTQDLSKTMAAVESKWKELDPGHPYEYFFLDKSFDSQYRSEERLASIFETFTMLAIIIGCLGLFGLASFTADQRTKEIGIRKSLGATSVNIVFLLSKEFVRWILAANILAWPAAYFSMNSWLKNFPYRANPAISVFLISAGLALVVALITVSWQSVRAARANPVDSLKYE